jgi:hypothetical protein
VSALDVLALDLEGTLISNTVSCVVRPGLGVFLERCHEDAIHPDERRRWIPIARFERPYPASDGELERVAGLLAAPRP